LSIGTDDADGAGKDFGALKRIDEVRRRP